MIKLKRGCLFYSEFVVESYAVTTYVQIIFIIFSTVESENKENYI